MESLERKDTSAGTEEPVKSENVVTPSPASSDRSSGAVSPPPHCSICLGKLINTSFTDSCLHQFCFTCLLQWAKIKTECPLCKQTFKSIIHNVRSEGDYDQYHVPYTSQVAAAATLDVTADIHIRGPWDNILNGMQRGPLMYRTTQWASNYRRMRVLLNPDAVARREQLPSVVPQVSADERRQRSSQPLEFRRRIYRTGRWATPLPDAFGRFRECNAEFYRIHPGEIDRLIPWLNRELQVLLDENPHHVPYVINVITNMLRHTNINCNEFRDRVRPYFGNFTDQFQHEFYNFARSNFDMIGYDQAVNYIPSRGFTNEYIPRPVSPESSSSSSSSSDSEVRVINHVCDFRRMTDTGVPISSLVSQPVSLHFEHLPGPSSAIRLRSPQGEPDILTISSSSESENDCEVVGYVKPRHERTPEIIDLSSSDGEEASNAAQSAPIEINRSDRSESPSPAQVESLNQPSTSTASGCISKRTRRCAEDVAKSLYDYLDSSSESTDDETDSDYNPSSRNKSRRGHKSASKKSPSKSSRALRSRKRTSKSSTNGGGSSSNRPSKSRIKSSRTRSDSYSRSAEDEDASPSREVSSGRGTKRYLSKSSDDDSDYGKSSKAKKNKKSKSCSRKRKRQCLSAAKSRARRYSNSSDRNGDDSSTSSDSEAESKGKTRRRKKVSSSKSRISRSSRLVDYDLSDEGRTPRHSSSDSENVRKNATTKDSCSSDDDRRKNYSEDGRRSSRGGCSSSENSTAVMPSRSKSADSPVEHSAYSSSSSSGSASGSAWSKLIRERQRSRRKKCKESKKRRRSHS